MDLTVVYSKTAKGLRARASLIGGLSSQLMRVLSHIDGVSKAETILVKLDEITELKLAAALTQLETEGYIKAIAITNSGTDDWALTSNFSPMVVEDFQGTISAEIAESAEAKDDSQAKLKFDYKAKLKEEARLQAEAKAQEKEDQARAKAEEKAQLEAERKAEEERIAEAESKAIEEASKQAELKATAAAEQARTKALTDAKENAKREIERLTHEADEAKKQAQAQAEIEAQFKAEAERKAEEEARKEAELLAEQILAQQIQAQQVQAEQEKIQQEAEQARAKALADAKAQADTKAQADAEALADAEVEAAENSRLEAERIALAAKQAQQKSELEALAKAEQAAQLEAEAETAAKLEAQRNAEIMEEARLAAAKKAKHEEEERLAVEHELIAQAEEKAKQQAKADEKERARLDIARIVREAEETRKKTEAEAREARLEAKREEKAAEEQKKAEIEAIAKAEQESKKEAERKIKALEEAGLKAESKQKAQAERYQAEAEAKEKASAEANLKASLAMQSFVTDAESAQKNADAEVIEEEAQLNTVQEMSAAASLKAEITAKIKAEHVRAKYEADEKALAEEKELARQEMERISREAELERQKQGSQASSKAPAIANADADAIKVKWANPDDDDDDDDFKEEERIAGEVEKVGLEIKKKTKRVAEVEGRQEIIRAAQEEAHVKAKSKVESKPFALSKHLGKWASAVRKVLLIYLPPAILLVLVLLHFINISPLVAPIEKLASDSLGTPVVIEQVRASLWPRPHLVLKNITIGADSAQKIEAINIAPVRLGLSEGVKTIKSIDIEGLKIEQENFGLALQWIASLSKAQNFKIEQITLHKIVLKIKDFELLPLDGKVMLTESRELKTIDLITGDETLAMQLTPQGSNFDIALVGTKWALPMNAKVVFSELKAKGSVKQSSILFDQIEGTIYGGSFTGKAALGWSNQWSLAGKFDLSNANLPEIMKAFASSASVDGKFKLAGIFSCQSKLAAALTNAPEINANFTAQNGKINGVELDRALLSKNSQSLAGDSTRFDKLTGSVKIKNGSYQYRQLVLRSDQFYADGNVDIQPNQDISGRINADLAAQSRRLQASFTLAGKVSNVKRQ